MTGKPCEKLHVIHLRCWWCLQHHYNTHNQGTVVVVHNTYPDDPRIFHITNIGGRYPLGLPIFTAEFDRLRMPTNQYYSWNLGETFMAEGVFHNTVATHIPSSMPSLKDISM